MMEKDPAFLMYSKDWLEGTADLMPEEKGVFIDLLCHQHQKGSLPSDTARLCRLAGLSEDKFLPIWEVLKGKFKPLNGSKLSNSKMEKVVGERSGKGNTNRITGEFAYLIRTSTLTTNERVEIKELFNTELFLHVPANQIKYAVKEWFEKTVRNRLHQR